MNARRVTDVIFDLDHWRRARRLLPILVDRHGLSWFLVDTFPKRPRFDDSRLERCVDVAADWIARRSGRPVDEHGRATMLQMLQQHLRDSLRRGATVVRR